MLSPQQIFDARVLKEQGAIEKAGKALRDQRIRRAFQIDPDLSIDDAAERFGMTYGAMHSHMRRLGIVIARDMWRTG